ncbi:MAG: sodium/proton antiporter NhaB [Psychrobium sp.]|nr:sodium/proton antiporter NhaB [Psychrobium sp.]
MPLSKAFMLNFLGNSPKWYKYAIISFLIINPLVFFFVDPFVAGWMLVVEFIFTLAMALKCYPLQPGGLLAIEAIAIGMSSSAMVLHEMQSNMEVILLLIFMVAGIYFMKDLLLYMFTKLITKLRSKIALSVAFCVAGAVLSAFLDALTVIAVIISVVIGFYSVYHKVASGKEYHHDHDHTDEEGFHDTHREDLEQFRGFLRNLLMHAGVGTALGGVMTKVGEPQNLIIAQKANWEFIEFAIRMSPVTIPVFFCGILTCIVVEKMRWFSYGEQLPTKVHTILSDFAMEQDENRSRRDTAKLLVQASIAVWLVVGLAFHLAAVGLIGLSVIVLATAFNGITEEHALGKAFEEALPFTALLGVFFAIVAVIIEQNLFTPVVDWVLTYEGTMQMVMFYIANGLLSMVSDNVFVGTVYIEQIARALESGQITREQFDMLAVAINTGTNLPSVATPNGQAAFLFLLTSALAPLVRLSYGRMVYMALPYTIVLSIVGFITIYSGFLEDMTETFYDKELIQHHSVQEVNSAKPAAH